MHFEADHIYHVYNRGNNKTIIFFSSKNYLYLLQKIRNEWLVYCDIYSYCLMPNHFHFMIQPKKEGCETIILKEKTTHLQNLSKAIGKTLSSYTQAINIQNNATGNLFQKKTRAKCLSEQSILEPPYSTRDYLVNCFFYIHNNPLTANIIDDLKQWPYSSWPDYYGFRNGTLCNMQRAMQRIGFSEIDFKNTMYQKPDKKIISSLW
jgi:putative transposase